MFNKWCWDNWIFTCERMKLNLYLTPLTKVNSKGLKTMKLLENIGTKLLDVCLGNNFFGYDI